MLAALLCFALLDGTSKHLTQIYSVPFLVWARYTLHFLIMVIFLAPSLRWQLIATRRPLRQIVRAMLLVAVTGLAMAAFRVMPLAEATALLFINPLLAVLLAGPLLGERVGRLRWLAVLAGFAGTVLIVRPGSALAPAGIGFALAAAACYALYQIQTRQLSPSENTVTMLFYTALVGTTVMTLGLPWFHLPALPPWQDLALIASLGIYGGTGHLLLIRAFRLAQVSTLSPFLYTQLIWATLIGWVVYRQLPDTISFFGIGIVAASGLAVALAERRRAPVKAGDRYNPGKGDSPT